MPKLDRHELLKLLLFASGIAVCILAYYFGVGRELIFALLASTLFLSFALLHLFDRLLKHEVPANIVLKVVLGENLSADVLRVLRTEVGDEALFRKQARWKFSFYENGTGITMVQKITSQLVNRSGESRIHELADAHSSPDVKLKTYTFEAKKQSKRQVFTYHEGMLRNKSVTVEPRIEYDEELLAEGHYTKREVSGEHQTRTLIEELTIVFEYPAHLQLEMFPHFSCPGPRRDPDNLGNGTKRLVRSAKVVLPQQGISFRLFEIPRADGMGERA